MRLLKDTGFSYFSLSDSIRDELTRRGMEHSRENLRLIGNDLRETFGASVLADRIKENLPANSDVVIDSIRNVYEVNSLRALENFNLISIDAPIEERFKRANQRGRNENAVDLESFRRIEDLEKSQVSTAQNLSECMKMADYHLYNDGTIDEFYQKINLLLEKLRPV
ncbi:AAA family ATPase [candidate division KSB1 bacterium]|nr:AAA family ATPase [candidate division KSB1 bacterium]